MRNLLFLFLVLAIGMMQAAVAMAADWQEYFHSQADARYYIDRNSIASPGKNKVRAWDKMIWPDIEAKAQYIVQHYGWVK